MKANTTDLIGKKFGMLTVLEFAYIKNKRAYWKCKCDCGKEKIVSRSNLVNGLTTSCGCARRTIDNDLMVGKRFGKLTVIRRSGSYSHGGAVYTCKCDCGNECNKVGWKLRNGHIKSCGNCNHIGEEHNGIKIVGQLSKGKVICKCPYCGKAFESRYSLLTSGRVKSCGCISKQYKDLTGMKFGKLTVLQDTGRTYRGNHIWHCKCDCGNEKNVRSENLIDGNTTSCGCLTVNFSGSNCENEIKDYIATLISDKPQKVKILGGKEIDLYYDKYKLGIEYNGSAFHSSIGNVYEDKDKNYHRDKFLCAKEKGIHLINIFDVDWNKNKNRIKLYLKDLVCKKHKLYARKCVVKSIDRVDATKFCEEYHLQGWSKIANIYYGLYYNEQLVSVMTFGRQRMKKEDNKNYELVRYCVKSGYTIVGGANKLLKTFEMQNKPLTLVSYSDNDYFTGGIYNQLGFEYDKQCSLSYYWYMNGKEYKREECQVNKLKKLYPNLYAKTTNSKENYIMVSLGAKKVYRSGNTRWIKRY